MCVCVCVCIAREERGWWWTRTATTTTTAATRTGGTGAEGDRQPNQTDGQPTVDKDSSVQEALAEGQRD